MFSYAAGHKNSGSAHAEPHAKKGLFGIAVPQMFPKFGFYAGFSTARKKRRSPVTVEITGFCVAEKEGFEEDRMRFL